MIKQNTPNSNQALEATTLSPAARYDAATKILLQRVRDIETSLNFTQKFDMSDMVIRFRTAFQNPQLRKMVLVDKYESARIRNANFSSGFCGIASYAWTQIFRAPNGGTMWQLYQYSASDIAPGLAHHVWLKNAVDGQILDLTFDQSVDSDGNFVDIPYHLGTRVSEHFPFKRAFEFGKFIGIDIQTLAFKNALRDGRH